MSPHPPSHPISWSLIWIAVALLLLGGAIYWFMRPHESVYAFHYFGLNSAQSPSLRVGTLGGFTYSLPSLLHVLAFSLLTFAVLTYRTRLIAIAVASFWVTINVLFEVGQAFGSSIHAALPNRIATVPWFQNLGPYFVNGNFDVADIVFSVLGGVLAYLICIYQNEVS